MCHKIVPANVSSIIALSHPRPFDQYSFVDITGWLLLCPILVLAIEDLLVKAEYIWLEFSPLYHWVTRPKNFIETDTETFFRDQNFRDRDRDFFSRPNIFETDTETFFRDQMFSRPIPRLFFETKCFRDRYRDFFSRPNVFETDTETFLRPNFFETDTETFAKVKK